MEETKATFKGIIQDLSCPMDPICPLSPCFQLDGKRKRAGRIVWLLAYSKLKLEERGGSNCKDSAEFWLLYKSGLTALKWDPYYKSLGSCSGEIREPSKVPPRGTCENRQRCFRWQFSHSTSVLIYPKSSLLIYPKLWYPKLPESLELRQIAMDYMLAIQELRFIAGCRPTKHFNCYPNFWFVTLRSLFWAGGLTICKPSSLVEDKHIMLRYAYEQNSGARLFIQTREGGTGKGHIWLPQE